MGPLPLSQGYTYLFTVDRFTRWPEAIPLASIDTKSCARAFARNWIARFGVPGDMSSDRGAQFTSDLWASLSNLLGIQLHRTTAYHPQANGLVERFHRSLKASLRARLTSAAWMDELPWVLLGLRTVPKDDLGASSAEMVYGAPLAVPGDFILPPPAVDPAGHLWQLRDRVGALAPVPTALHGQLHRQSSVPASLATTPFVFVRRDGNKKPLQTPYTGPYRVLARRDKTFTIDYGGREETVSIDRLKPAHVDPEAPVQVAQPPRRGRPPRGPAPAPPARAPEAPGPAPTPPAQAPAEPAPSTAQQTRSGRAVRRPRRLNLYVGL